MIKISVEPGEEIISKVSKIIEEKNIKEGSLVSIIGAVDECCISTMSKEDAKKDILSEYHEPLELSGTGEIHEGVPHIHVVLGRERNKAIFGHLRWGRVKSWFVHVYVLFYT